MIKPDKGCVCSVTQSDSLRPLGLQPASLLRPWDSPGKNTGVSGLPFPSPGDLPNPGQNLGLLHLLHCIPINEDQRRGVPSLFINHPCLWVYLKLVSCTWTVLKVIWNFMGGILVRVHLYCHSELLRVISKSFHL